MSINKNYLQLEFGSGLFFEYSKGEKEGHTKHTSSKDNISYRKYYKDGVTGVLESVSIFESKFGNQLSMNIKDGDEVYYVPVNIADQRGNVDTYAESLTKLLPSLNKGDKITVRGYNFTPDGEQYAKVGISITSNGEKLKGLSNAYYKDGVLVEGDIPATAWKKDALGKNKPTAVSLEAKNDYLLEVIKTQTERLKWTGDNSEAPKPESPKVDESKSFAPTNDNLPF